MSTQLKVNHPRASAAFIFSALVALILVFPRPGSTHEPITTKVMFNKEIIRILQRNCLGCHSQGHIKADIPLTTYDEARPWAKAIKEEILEKRMMPFQAVKGFGSFQHDYILPQRDVDMLVSWIEGGAPRGEEKDYPKEAVEQFVKGQNWLLGQPDLILQPETEAKIPADGDDEIRCFVLPTNFNQDRWIRAFDFQPGNGAVVYNASFLIERSSQPRKINPSNNKGNACGIRGEEANTESLGQWVPGQAVNRFPNGAAHLLPANSRILLKIRYRKNREATTDRSRIGLYFAKDQTNKSIRNITINSGEVTVLPNEDRQRVKATYTIAEPTEAIAIRPLLFPLAQSVEVRAYRPDGTIEVLIWAKNYRFDWQPAYYFRKPIVLPKGTRLELTAQLNNSDTNSNNLDDQPAPVKSVDALCEITLTSAVSQKAVPLKQASR